MWFQSLRFLESPWLSRRRAAFTGRQGIVPRNPRPAQAIWVHRAAAGSPDVRCHASPSAAGRLRAGLPLDAGRLLPHDDATGPGESIMFQRITLAAIAFTLFPGLPTLAATAPDNAHYTPSASELLAQSKPNE